MRAGVDRAARPAADAARLARGDRHRRPPRARLARARQGLPRRRPRLSRPRSTTRPTSSPARATRPRSRRCSRWCAEAGAAAIPYGGGTSVVGGIEPRVGDGYAGAVTIDLGALDRVLEVDPVSRAARIQAGDARARAQRAAGRARLTLRHFPQSFEYSTLGGWIATRAGRPLRDRLDPHRRPRRVGPRDHPERRLGEPPAARLGRRPQPRPDADRLRGDPRRDHRGLGARPRAARAQGLGRRRLRFLRQRRRGGPGALGQSGLNPSNCRLLDEAEAGLTQRRRRPRGPRPRLRVRPPARRRA